MYNRMLELPLSQPHSLFLFGPRGVGKTSWLKERLPDAIYLDLLDFHLYSDLLADPSRLNKLIPPGHAGWVIIDEVQRVPELLNEVHRLIESKKYRFLLTGSSSRSLKRRGVNLLAGRALRYHMHPLLAQELGQDFDFIQALRTGLLPMAVHNPQADQYLKTYVQTYLREEVLQEGLTRNLSAFTRFLEVASFSQGATINMSEIAREVGIDRQVVSNYFSILEDLLLSHHLPAFTKRAKRRMVQHTKFFYFDVGVYRALRPRGPLDIVEEIDGAALETLFLQSLLALNDYLQLGYQFYFWRTSSGLEVDFIAYGEKGLFAFEIKRSTKVHSKMLRALKAFKEDYPEATCYLIYGGEHAKYHDNITVLSIQQALLDLPKLLGYN